MGTTKTDTQTAQYDPGSKALFGGLTGALGQTLPGFITSPFQSPQFGLEQQMGTRQAQNLGQTGVSNLLRNMTTSGLFGGASSPAGLEMLQNQQRANTGLQANLGFLSPVMNALQRQQFAMGLGSQYRPLQTGQKQVEATSGLGTWLPQVTNLGMGLATGWMSNRGSAFGLPNSANAALSSGPGLMSGVPSYGSWSGLSGANPMFGAGGGSAPGGSAGMSTGGSWFPGLTP